MNYCCLEFKKLIEEKEIITGDEDGYILGYFDSYLAHDINFCPFCGAKL